MTVVDGANAAITSMVARSTTKDANGSRRRTATGTARHTAPTNAATHPPADEAPLASATNASKP